MSKTSNRQLLSVLGFACLLLLPSFDMPLKYLRFPGLAAYFLIGVVGIVVCYYFVVPRLLTLLSERVALMLMALTFVGLIVVVAVGYPIANSGRFGGGSDIDDAMIIGVNELVAGRYPYYQATYLGTTLSPMPGVFLLAFPFVITGLLAYQNIFWLAAWALTVKRFLNKYSISLLVLWTLLAISPTAYQVLVTGSDHLSNTLYILVAMWLVIGALTSSSVRPGVAMLAAVLLGVGLSSRSNFMLLTPLFFSVLVQNVGWKTAIRYCAIVAVVFAVITLPFWAYDPAHFAPIEHAAGRLDLLDSTLPFASTIVPISTFILTAILALTKMGTDCAAFFRNCAIVQLFALYLPSVVWALGQEEFTLFMGAAGYGMFSMIFGVTSAWIYMTRDAPDMSVSSA